MGPLGDDFDWNHARAFLVTAQEGSLSAAARTLGQTQPTLSRQVAAFESELGVTLFERVGKRLVLTETGRDLMTHVSAMADAASRTVLQASGHAHAVFGEVRIGAGELVSARLLPPLLEKMQALYPELEFRLVVSNYMSDLLRREADIAIRHVRPEQPDLVARKVRDTSAHLYASTRWLVRHGRPKVPADLSGAHFIGADDNARFVEILSRLGVNIGLENFRNSTNSHLACWELVKQGLGIGGMLREVGEATPEVEEVLPDLPPIPVPFWLCTHRELHTSRKIRVVFDFLAEALGQTLLA